MTFRELEVGDCFVINGEDPDGTLFRKTGREEFQSMNTERLFVTDIEDGISSQVEVIRILFTKNIIRGLIRAG